MAEPTFTDEEWDRIQAALGDRTASGKARHITPNPLAGIGYCICGYSLARHRRKSSSGKLHTYVRCGRPMYGCRGAVKLQDVELLLEEQFLDAHGDREMVRMVLVPGEDRSQELVQTEQSLERLRWESDNGLVDDEALYKSRLTALVALKKELTANTVVSARWDKVGTGKTYRELWSDETTDRRQVLRDSGIRLVLHCPPRGTTTQTKVMPWEIQTPDDWPLPDPVELPSDPDFDARVAALKRRRTASVKRSEI
jgi:site-specific DNA recombinase